VDDFRGTRALVNKVAPVTVAFWVIKVLSTAMGEATSDFLVHTIGAIPGVAIGFVLFAVTLTLQFTARGYSSVRYWSAIVGVSVFGTMVADVAHVGLGIPYWVSALICAAVLAGVFITWWTFERTLSIHSIVSRRRESFYWLAVLVTFALGTAVGDLTAITFGLGYLGSGIIFAVAIALPGLAFRYGRADAVATFWTGYVLTRPLGASFADWFGVSEARGGLALGSGWVALVLTCAIVVAVALARRKESSMNLSPRRLRRWPRRLARALQFDHHAYWRARPLRLGTVMYESFSGNGMLCNPEAIFRHLLRRPEFASFEHIWVLSEPRRYRDTIDEFRNVHNVRFVRYRSPAYFRALATSEYLINNATFPSEFSKRPGQVYVNTWHGTPLKRMGYHMPAGAHDSANTLRNFVAADFLLAANPFMAEQMYESAYKLSNAFRGLIIEEGYPRIDRQRLQSDQFIAVRARLERAGVPLRGRDVVLYAPTWKGESFARPEDDIDALVAAVRELQARLGDDRIVLLKTHQIVHSFASSKPALAPILVPNDIPTNEVLGITTALVTDYSSIFFDYLATGRPIAFYTPDMADYSDTRGVYFPASDWPGPVCTTMAEVGQQLDQLLGAEQPAPSETYLRWQARFAAREDGDVTRRVVDVVFHGRRRGYQVRPARADARPRVLFYLGGMRSNGITTSALNLLSAIDHDRFDVSVVYARSNKRQQRSNQNKIHPAVRQFPRLGGMNGNKLAHVKRELAERNGRTDLHRADRSQTSLWDEEWVRCFGDLQFDEVIDFSGYSPFWATLLLHSPPATRSIWLHNDMAAEVHREVGGTRAMSRSLPAVFALYREFDRLVSVSPRLNALNRRKLAGYAPADRFVAVSNVIDAQRVLTGALADIRELDGYPVDENTGGVLVPDWVEQVRNRNGTTWFVTVARLSPEKNQERLIRAFATVYADRADVRLLIVGQGYSRAALQKTIDALGLSDAVFLTGSFPNPFAIMAAADCFVLSSNYEGQPMVLLEAAVLGLPIVSVDFASVHDALPGESIHVVPQTDRALAEGMRAFLRGDVLPSSLDVTAYTRKVLSDFERLMHTHHVPTGRYADDGAQKFGNRYAQR
jgi:CDP-glycerol glycerophosphotransferase